MVDKFPYFSISDYPWVGTDSGILKGLYYDERAYVGLATKLINKPFPVEPEIPLSFQPWLQLLAIGGSILIFGLNLFSVRLPSAIFSSVSIVIVYLICVEKFENKTVAFLSSLYLIAMFPALVFNRMVFLENGVALFFLAAYFCLLQYSKKNEKKYMILSVIFSGCSFLCKITGLVTPLFLAIYLAYNKRLKKNIKFLSITVALVIIFPVIASVFYQNLLHMITSFIKNWYLGRTGNEFSIWTYMFLNTMPSGYITEFRGYPQLEYWYVFAYIALAYLTKTERKKAIDIYLVIFTFVGLFYFAGGIGSYFITIIQPFLAIPMGYLLKKIMTLSKFSLLLMHFLFTLPMQTALHIYIASLGGITTYDQVILIPKIIIICIPIILMLFSYYSSNQADSKRLDLINNKILVLLFLGTLILNSYLPVFYPHYLLVKTTP